MRYEVALTDDASAVARQHLLQHYDGGGLQEDVCFALWHPSTGRTRTTALISEVLIPQDGETHLLGNASFESSYLGRAISSARKKHAGIALLHSHPSAGWQGLSAIDQRAEQEIVAPPSRATGMPFVGLTSGSDGTWSARFWLPNEQSHALEWCNKVRTVNRASYQIDFNDHAVPPAPRHPELRRTFDTWGTSAQDKLSRLNVGIVGVGSVGSVVAEAMARIGVGHLTLIDPDRIEIHNLDRLWFATRSDKGRLKVDVAKEKLTSHATAADPHIEMEARPIEDELGYQQALDCDIIFSCVDGPIARNTLNYIANSHLIPVIDIGVAVRRNEQSDELEYAHWKSQLVTPNHICLRCSHQYTRHDLTLARDGSLDDPTYAGHGTQATRLGNENVFPFTLGAGAMAVEEMLRYVAFPAAWPATGRSEHQVKSSRTKSLAGECEPCCEFKNRAARGDAERPFDLVATPSQAVDQRTTLRQRMRGWLPRFGRRDHL